MTIEMEHYLICISIAGSTLAPGFLLAIYLIVRGALPLAPNERKIIGN